MITPELTPEQAKHLGQWITAHTPRDELAYLVAMGELSLLDMTEITSADSDKYPHQPMPHAPSHASRNSVPE
jgi:hypothetical protein